MLFVKTQTIMKTCVALFFVVAGTLSAVADGPADNQVDGVRRIPKLGIEVPAEERAALETGLAELAKKIGELKQNSDSSRLLPDIEIFHRAVEQALKHQEFFDAKELPVARKLLEIGLTRAAQLQAGKPEWTRQTGLVVRGYRSKIDQTVQPYGLVIPDDYSFDAQTQHRLDLWFHGRGEVLSEVNFIQGRLTQKGEFTPPGVIVLHPYGRYCNANKFAGEIDTFEALENARQHYRINPEKVAVRGFSMGGAAVWQFAVHYPSYWFAANPGAGFSETPDFLKVFQKETLQPTWYEQKLWRMYDCTDYAANLAFLPTVAYSGDMDSQKQAADIMEIALKKEGLPLLHIIGPMTAHKLHPDSKVEIDKILSKWERLGPPSALKSPLPADGPWETIDQLVTYTLRYNQSRMVTITGLEEHWEPARVVVQKTKRPDGTTALRLLTKNVTSLRLNGERTGLPRQPRSPTSSSPNARQGQIPQFEGDARQFLPGFNPFRIEEIDGQPVQGPSTDPRGSTLVKTEGKWVSIQGRDVRTSRAAGLQKIPGLQGPIDDAFMDSFIFVKPTSKGLSEAVDQWALAEFEHAVEHWRRQFRGDARIKLDTEITKEDMQTANIVLFGDLQSNEVLGTLAEHLPITWNAGDKAIVAGEQKFDQAHHALIAIYPNPLAPHRYVVLNSGFTYREYDYLNNARQTPKLPDWAIVDVRTPPNSRFPGKIVAADFFNEQWQLKPPRPMGEPAAEPAVEPAK